MTDIGRTERERKFLVSGRDFFEGQPSTRFLQGYLVVTPRVELRIRTGPAGQTLTVKGELQGIERPEEEFAMQERPLAFALIEACDGRVLVKTRYVVPVRPPDRPDGAVDQWTVDEYHGDNQGLVVAEYEYPEDRPISDPLWLPSWIRREVTQLLRYYAQRLVDYPFSGWRPEERAY